MTRSPLDHLGVTLPVLAAPMAGDAGTMALAVAAARAGSLGFLAGGYKTAAGLAGQLAELRRTRSVFGVNLFAPNPLPVDRDAFRRYAAAIQADAETYGLPTAGAEPAEDDDGWAAKLDLVLADPVPLVSFTFGIPDAPVIAALRARGSLVAQTVTSVAEASAAAEAGVDLLIVQASAAGGHSGTLTPRHPPPAIPLPELIGRVRSVTPLPLLAAGGLATAEDVAEVRAAGAAAAMAGTALLRTPEAGTSAAHRAALIDPARRGTMITRAFTGRPARALRNGFLDRHDAEAPFGYPALHHLTGPMRKAAAAAGDPERIHLWAGTGHRSAAAAPAAQILAGLAGSVSPAGVAR
jgi:NAD(P)H-dependent flavin oxidoreductase YrpB (nitropropane dioxygenase family)